MSDVDRLEAIAELLDGMTGAEWIALFEYLHAANDLRGELMVETSTCSPLASWARFREAGSRIRPETWIAIGAVIGERMGRPE